VRAVVLVGGFGTRMRPLTLTTPKPMLPVVDRPIIEWILGGLASAGIDEAVLALGFKPSVFHDAHPDDTCAGGTPSSPSRSTPPAPSGSPPKRRASVSASWW
jgi:NDP-sugar pyrophosphorylase family protein